MQKSMLSVFIGLGLGCLLLAVVFCAFSLASPGWLRAALWPPTPAPIVIVPTHADPIEAGTLPAPLPTSALPTPTLPPLPTAVGAPCGGPEQIVIALLGVDDRTGNYSLAPRTDALTLVRVHFPTKSATLLSLPRDLYVPLPNLKEVGIYQDRLNTAYLYGEIYGVPGGGPAELRDTIAWNFGVRIDRYMMVNFGAFISVVDALGGIDVDAPEAIYDPLYPANEGSGTIIFELPAGRQHMDGETALRYARTRHQDDDYHRIRRQQLVLLAVRDRLFRPETLAQIPTLLSTMASLTRTDLAPEEIAALACIGPQIDRAAILSYAVDANMVIPWTTPTGGRVSIPDRDEIAPIVTAFLGQ